MNTNSNVSLNKLNKLVEVLSPIMTMYQFRYEKGQSDFSSGGQFANCFFINEKIKIGLIYRRGQLGSINYEGTDQNIAHGSLIKALGKESDQQLLYNENQFCCYTFLNEGEEYALLLDLKNIILPFIANSSAKEIQFLLNNQPKRWSF